MTQLLLAIVVVMVGAMLVIFSLMTPVEKVNRFKLPWAAFYGITGVLLVFAGLGMCCWVALR